MEEINKLIETTKEAFPELEYDIEAIRMAFIEELEWGYDEDYIADKIRIELNQLVKMNKV